MLIDDEEERKKRLEEAMQITNQINSNNYQSNFDTNNYNSNDEYTRKLQEAMNITNSINPTITQEEISFKNINISPDLESKNTNVIQDKQEVLNLQEVNNINETDTFKKEMAEIEKEKVKSQIDQKVKKTNTSQQSVSINSVNNIKEQKSKSEIQKLNESNNKIALENNIDNKNYISDSEINAKIEAQKLNKDIEKGGIDAFNSWVATVGNNIFGGTKKVAAGLANIGTTLAGLGIRGIQGLNGLFGGNKKIDEKLQSTYEDVIQAGSDIKAQGDYYTNITNNLNNEFIKTSGNVTDVATGVVINAAIGYATGMQGAGTIAQSLSVGGSSAQEVLDKNKDNIAQATVTALAKGYVSYFTENMFDANILTRGTSKTSIEKGINSLISKNIESKLGKELAHKTIGIIGENLEEVAEDNLGYIIDRLVNNEDMPGFKEWWANSTETAKITTASMIILNLLGLGGGQFEDIEKDIQAEHWINEAQRIIKKEDMAIHYNSEVIKSISDMQEFYVTKYNLDGELTNIIPTLGKEIANPNSKLNIDPVVIQDSNTNYYQIIDGNTGVVLDSTYYENTMEAQFEFNKKVNNLDDIQIDNINNQIEKADYSIKDKIVKTINEARDQLVEKEINKVTEEYVSQNQQNDTIDQNNIQGQENNNQQNKIAQNGISDETNTTQNKSFEDVASEAMQNINNNEIESPLKNRNIETIGKQKNVKAYQYENPEVKPYFQDMAKMIGEDLSYISDTANRTTKKGGGTKLSTTTKAISTLHDEMGYSYNDIAKGLQNIIEDNGKENNAISKKLELIIDEQLRNGYTNALGKSIAPNQEYINAISNLTDKTNQNQERGNNNVRAERIRSKNTQQEANRNNKGENARRESENAKSNGMAKGTQSKGLSNYQKQQQKIRGKDFKAELVESKAQSQNEQIVSSGFKELTGLDLNVYKTNKATTEGAFYSDEGVFLKHNSLANKKATNFLPFHELGHWFKVNRNSEWTAIHDIIDNTITKNQIEEYKNVLNDTSIFDNMSEAEIREYIIEEIESDYFGNWANDISNWENMLDIMPIEYQNLLADICLENVSTHYNIFGTQEQQEQVYDKINDMMNNFITENKNTLKTDFENNIKLSNRKADVIFEKDGKFNRVKINEDIFANNTSHKSISRIIHDYLMQHIGEYYYIIESGQKVYLGDDLPNEYTHSVYSQNIKSAQRLAKGRAVSGLKEIIENATNRKFEPNRKAKHKKDAKYGFYRYETTFSFEHNNTEQIYSGIILIRNDEDGKKYLYDILDIKKIGSNLPPVASNSKTSSAIIGGSNSLPTNSIAQKNKSVKSTTVTNSNMQKSKNNTIKKSERYDVSENGEGGFYSQLEKVIEEKMPNTSNAQQIRGIIENSGIKQDEIKWIGLDDYLKQHSLEKISKQQLQDYIKANQINIETVQKGTNKLDEYTEPVKQDIASKNIDIQYILDKYGFDYESDDLIPYKRDGLRAGTIGDFMAENLEKYIDLNDFDKYEKQEDGSYIRTYRDSDGIQWTTQFTEKDFKEDMQKLEDLYEQRTEAEMQLSSLEDEYGDYADELGVPKYKQYSLEGGTNYKELLYTLPYEQNGNDVKNLQIANVDEYNSPHWQEKNVLAHARTQDFEDIYGSKVLFIDEIQSDLHQEGRQKGYLTKEDAKKKNDINKKINTLKEEYSAYENELKNLKSKAFSNAKETYIQKQNEAIKQSSLLEEKYNIQNNLTEEQQYELLHYVGKIEDYLIMQNRQFMLFRENIDNNEYMQKQVEEAEKVLKLKLPHEILEKQKNISIYRQHAIESFRISHYDQSEVRYGTLYSNSNNQYLTQEEQTRITELNKLMFDIETQNASLIREISQVSNSKISDVFPFKKNWHEFVLRRMINNAVEQGYDEVAWTTGRQQRERYNLAKVIDSIEYEKLPYTAVSLVDIFAQKNGDIVFSRVIKSEELADYIGKDLAARILNSKENKGTISNLDEEIRENGNSGMYVFYDQEIPNYLNKYLKKWNSKVEEITLKDADGKSESKQMGFKITEEMRNSIKQNGQPLFSNRQLDEEAASTYDERIQRKNRELIKEIREQKESIQGLEGYSRTEIKDIVNNYIQDKLVENDLEDVSINGAEIIGSRNRGNAKTNSDLDLVVEYSGDIREDDLFNILNEEPLEIEGIKVDINPITADNTGTLEEYLERSKQYDREVLNTTNKETIRKEDPNVAPGATNAQGADRFIEQEISKIEATGNWDNSIPTTRLTDIRETIEDYLGLGIKKGHFRERAYGIYKEGRDVIRGKELKDIDNILHETGHALDLGNRLKIDKESIASELLTAVKKHGGYENETRSVQLDEGFAEVIRAYSIIPEQAQKDYPQTVAVLEEIRKADKSFDNFITKVQQQTYNYIHQNPQNRVHSNISIGESNRTPLTKAWLEQEVMRNVWDKDYAVKKVVNEFSKISGKNTKASNNAYYLTRLATGIHDRVTSMLSDGYINEKGDKIMPGLNKVGEILGDNPQRYNDLRDYLVARRDTDYKAKTLKTGIRDMDTKYVLEKFKNDTQINEAAQIVYDTLDGVMKYAVDNGLISEETAKDLKNSNAFYVPMQRVIEGRGNQIGRKGAVSDIIKARTGSELDIKDVLENIVSNSSNIIQQVENNNVLRALYKQGEEAGLTGSIYDVIDTPMIKIGTANLSMWESELKKQGVKTTDLDLEKTVDLFAPNNKVDAKNLITSFIDENGKRIYLQFNDEILFNSLMNMDKKFMSNVLKINSKLNMPLRYGATMANIGFAIPNIISDTAQAAIFSNAGFIPVVDNALGVLDILTATNKHIRNFVKNYSPEYVNRIENMYNIYKQSGATNSTRMSQYRDTTQNVMKDIYGTKNSEVLGIHEKWKPLKRLLDLMTYIPEISEQSTRFRVFEKNYDMYKTKGTNETDARILAALESRDATQDFGRTGNLTREINQLIPFSAARVGSSYTFAEKIKANPKQTAMRIAILSALALAVKAIGYKDKEIEELNQRKKDDNFVIKVGDNVVTIKKPQGLLRSIVNLTEYIEDLATGHIEDGKAGERLGEWINNAIMDNMPADSVTGLVPNMVAPLIENAINKDLYYNTDIVKSYDLDLPNSQQYYEYNSQLAILLGKVFNYSPAKIDNLISGYFAGLGTQLTGYMDSISGKLGLTAQKAEMGAESDAVGKRFIVNVNSNSASVDEIYNRKTELTKKKNGGTITSDEESELTKLTDAVSNMSKVNKQIKEIKKDLTMSGTEKADKIRILQQQRTDIARQALGKDLIHEENSDDIKTTSFYPTNSALSLNHYSLDLTSEMKNEYASLASEFYKKYEKQGLYSQEKLKEIKSKAKEYAKKTLMQKYKSQLVKK